MTITTSSRSLEFIESVLRLQPRLAVFDCDGTLWAGDAGERFFRWELERSVISAESASRIRARHALYLAGRVSEDAMCGEMVTIHSGLAESDLKTLAEEFFGEFFAPQIFPEMHVLVERLRDSGCDVWAVSSTNEWVIEAGMKHFGIPLEKILAASVEVDGGIVTPRLIRVPSGEGKSRAIQEVIQRRPDAVFGNSRWDVAMLKMATHSFAVNPNPDLEKMARQQGWIIYWPEGTERHEHLLAEQH